MNKKLIFDLSLIAALVIASLLSIFFIEFSRERGSHVSVEIDGEQVMEIPLTKRGKYPLLEGKNILVIEDGCAYMEYADCPKQVCVNTGRVSMSGEKIVCSHNRIIVRVLSGGGEDILESH